MEREEAIEFIHDIQTDAVYSILPEEKEALDMAISALSTEGEYIKKEDLFERTINRNSAWNTITDSSGWGLEEIVNDLPTYSFPDSAENKEIKEPTLLESFKDGADKVVEIWAVKGKLQIRTHGVIHNCNGTFGNDISVKSVNGAISVFPDSADDNTMEWISARVGKLFPSNDYKCSKCGNILNFNGVNCGRGDANFCPNCGRKAVNK